MDNNPKRRGKSNPQPIQADTRLLSYQQIAVMLSCSVSQVHALRAKGRFPIKEIRIGGMVRYPRAAVEKWIDRGCRP